MSSKRVKPSKQRRIVQALTMHLEKMLTGQLYTELAHLYATLKTADVWDLCSDISSKPSLWDSAGLTARFIIDRHPQTIILTPRPAGSTMALPSTSDR